MPRPPRLTDAQKRRLPELKKQLFESCVMGNIKDSKIAIAAIRELLLKSGHRTKYYELLLHYCELLITTNHSKIAIKPLKVIKSNVSSATRIFQEANLFLAFCYIHEHDNENCSIALKAAFESTAIKNQKRREQFLTEAGERLEEEALLASLPHKNALSSEKETSDNLYKIFQSNPSEDQILSSLGNSVPEQSIHYMEHINDLAKKQLTHNEKKMLPSTATYKNHKGLANKVLRAIASRAYPYLCKGKGAKYRLPDNPAILVPIIVELAHEISLTASMATYFAAFVVSKRIDKFCESYKPQPLMSKRYSR